MKRAIIFLVLISSVCAVQAQDEEKVSSEKKRGFKKENLFVGGDISLGFSSYYTNLGASPYFGYSLNKYVDVAASFNFNYISQRINDGFIDYGDKGRQTVYGPGVLTRIYPVKFLFAQAQFEHNFVKEKYIPGNNSPYLAYTRHIDANSLLVGVGYAGGRDQYNKSFYYFSISWDLLRNANSPYVDDLQRAVPIIKAGYNIALFQGKGR